MSRFKLHNVGRLPWVALAAVAVTVASGQFAAAAEPRVQLELVTGKGFPLGGQQRWIQFLGKVNVSNPRIRGGRAGDTLEIKPLKDRSGRVVSYHVTGLLSGRNTLKLPGKTFRYGDRAGINAWVAKLRAGGEENLYARKVAFGLTEKQLVAVHDGLARRVPFQTKGADLYRTVGKLAGLMDMDLAVDRGAATTIRSREPIGDELQGMSVGSAMAAVLRPYGVVIMPELPRGEDVRMRILPVRSATKSWPVGWPPKKSPGQAFPKYFKRLNVEIDDIAASSALDAIQTRLEVPFVYDRNSLARKQIDITQVRVSLPPGKTYYKDIVDTLLRQAELKAELRVDEAEQPFLWITTRRR